MSGTAKGKTILKTAKEFKHDLLSSLTEEDDPQNDERTKTIQDSVMEDL
jgi:hypothetical protein